MNPLSCSAFSSEPSFWPPATARPYLRHDGGVYLAADYAQALAKEVARSGADGFQWLLDCARKSPGCSYLADLATEWCERSVQKWVNVTGWRIGSVP